MSRASSRGVPITRSLHTLCANPFSAASMNLPVHRFPHTLSLHAVLQRAQRKAGGGQVRQPPPKHTLQAQRELPPHQGGRLGGGPPHRESPLDACPLPLPPLGMPLALTQRRCCCSFSCCSSRRCTVLLQGSLELLLLDIRDEDEYEKCHIQGGELLLLLLLPQ